MSEQKGYKRILQCPLCTKTPLIGLSMDEQIYLFKHFVNQMEKKFIVVI